LVDRVADAPEVFLKKNLLPIESIAAKLNLTDDLYERRTPVSAKLSLALLKQSPRGDRRGKLILVTATSPTASGEGQDRHVHWPGAGVGEDWKERDHHLARAVAGARVRHEGWGGWWWAVAD
jgi:formyltetrahydrofolate synthetase